MDDTIAYRYPVGRILVFAKAPLAGQVKTRLASEIGDKAAAALYEQLVRDTVTTAVQARLAPVTLYAGSPHPLFVALSDEQGIAIKIQQGADLGLRMHKAIQHELEQADFVVLIGTDCPSMTGEYLNLACQGLRAGTEFVLGPAEDGGYVLIGARSAEEKLFTDMRWSTSQVMQHTRERLHLLNRRYAELDTLWDLDTPEDLKRWQAAPGLPLPVSGVIER
ncbi:MAG: TIGR04282 family arsenosugar biosynthesis glycosyltransferase [Gammaproteobacteria bacterium]|nr:MAG: TIGR04282 family arsenosugar biosynthesis glycosyltransferase [Gammaproteobacteria bacterium]